MIQTLEKHEYQNRAPKTKTYIYRCGYCGSVIQFDNTDIKEEIYYTDIDHYAVCPECNHVINVWWISKWYHRTGIYKLFHKIKKNKEE